MKRKIIPDWLVIPIGIASVLLAIGLAGYAIVDTSVAIFSSEKSIDWALIATAYLFARLFYLEVFK